MAALTTVLMRRLPLGQAKPSYRHSDVRGLISAAVMLAKPNDTLAPCTNLSCFTGSQFLCNTPALSKSRARKISCAAYEDMDSKDKPEGINDPPVSDKDDADGKKLNEHNDDDAEDTEKYADQKKKKDDEKHLRGLKQDLVHALCGTNWGMTANRETHAVIADIITELEAVNPNPAPTESLELLDGKWIMVCTSTKEFLPFVAARHVPLVNVSKVSQIIDSDSLTVENVVFSTGPYMTTSFTNCASFDVRSSKRVQLKSEETLIDTSRHVDSIDVPEQTAFMGHKNSLMTLQDVLRPFQDMGRPDQQKSCRAQTFENPLSRQ